MAVGAQSGAVMRMVMRQGLLLAGGGTLLGVLPVSQRPRAACRVSFSDVAP